MILVVEYRHEKIRKFRGTDAALTKRLTKIMQDSDYRNHWYQVSKRESFDLFPSTNRWTKAGF